MVRRIRTKCNVSWVRARTFRMPDCFFAAAIAEAAAATPSSAALRAAAAATPSSPLSCASPALSISLPPNTAALSVSDGVGRAGGEAVSVSARRERKGALLGAIISRGDMHRRGVPSSSVSHAPLHSDDSSPDAIAETPPLGNWQHWEREHGVAMQKCEGE